MSCDRNNAQFRAKQPASPIHPQKIEGYVRPSAANGWLVRNYAPDPVRDQVEIVPARPKRRYRDLGGE